MKNQSNISSGLYYVIPAQVFEDESLEHSETIFYALLSGIAFSSGYCFASDDYLAERMKVDERTIRRWLEKLENIGYLKRETKKIGMKWERKIFICHSRPNSNNSYERTSMPGSKGHACPDRTGAHVRIVGEEELVSEEEHVCIETPKGAQNEKKSVVENKKKESLSLGQEATEFPSELVKYTPDGKEVRVKLNDVLLDAVKKKRNWETKEIHAAWKVLAEYSGAVYDPYRFIEGTIRNFKNGKRADYLTKEGKLCPNDEIMTYDPSKKTLSEEDMKEQRSLQWYLDQENLKK